MKKEGKERRKLEGEKRGNWEKSKRKKQGREEKGSTDEGEAEGKAGRRERKREGGDGASHQGRYPALLKQRSEHCRTK